MEEKDIRYCRKIRIYPTESQKAFFEKCFIATRFVWNNALEYISLNPKESKSHISLRKNTMLSNKELDLEKNKGFRWLKEIPYDTRQLTLKQLASNFKTNFTLLKNNQIKYFKMNFKSRKNPCQIFYINKGSLNLSKCKIFSRTLKDSFKVKKGVKRWIENNRLEYGDCIMKRERNKFFLCLPLIKKSNKVIQYYNKVVLDPGVRTFQTFYSDQNIAGKIGDNISEKLLEIGKKEDNIHSALDKGVSNKKTRYNMKKRCFLLRSKIRNIVNDLHWKTCHYLCSNFKHILLPTYDSSKMVKKSSRNIGSVSIRKMLCLSPFKFKERLIFMGKRMGCKIQLVNEAYTTKTCGGCGNLKNMLGLKVYECKKCNFTLDRDYNGARNIFLKYF
jgi:putative transposase